MTTFRIFSVVTICGILAAAPAWAAESETPPPIARVVIYPDGALVTRPIAVTCHKGTTTAELRGLPPTIDTNSLRAAVSGDDARLEGLSVVQRVREQSYSDDLAALEEQIHAAEVRGEALKQQAARADVDRERATALQQGIGPYVAREAAVEPKPNVAAWTAALDQTRKTIEQSQELKRRALIESREVQKQLAELQRRRSELQAAAPQKALDAKVALSCTGRASVELSYVVPEASWSPAYEARADEAHGTVTLRVLAQVQQSTGESWKDVAVTLSTALSSRDARPPKQQRLYLGANEQAPEKKVLVRREETADHLDADKNEAPAAGGEAAADQGLSVQLRVPGSVDVPGTGQSVRVPIETLDLPASFGLVVVPKVLPYVVHRAVAQNSAHYPLLPGPVDLFARGGYLGTGQLERTAEHDQLKLAFGLDEMTKVHRVVLAEQVVEKNFLGTSRKLKYGYRVELASSAKSPTSVEVQEPIPVSELDDVKVSVEKETTTPGAQLLASDGLLTWSVPLQPGERKNVEVHFSVEIPSSYDSNGL
jgi:uncharacterized protein (TIGR02231 family)